jgi:secondary thiamine-phosphate synthase enzyme
VDGNALTVVRRNIAVATAAHRQVVDVTALVQGAVATAGVQDGIAVVNCLHTTCSLVLDAADGARLEDALARFERLVPEDAKYKHNDPRYSDCERGNGAAHLRATLLGHGVMVGLEAGRLQLGSGSRSLLLVEWDGPRCRVIDLQIVGR